MKTATRRGKLIEYVEVALTDIALANELAHEVLGRSLDELPPQTRRLLMLVDGFVAERAKDQAVKRGDVRFSRRELREVIGWGDTQLKIHLARLADMEYVIAHREGAGFAYELIYDGEGRDGKLFVPNLIDVGHLKHTYDAERSGQNSSRSAPGRGTVGARSGGSRAAQNAGEPHRVDVSEESTAIAAKTQCSGDEVKIVSYVQAPRVARAATA